MTTKMKKFLCALTAAMMIGSLSGCFSDPEENDGTTTTPAASGTPGTTSSDTMPAPAGTGSSENSGGSANTENTPAGSDGGNGDYNADENGSVSDGSADNTNQPDEAAFASSYMNFAANGRSITKIGWGLGKETDGENRPLDAVNAEEKYGELSARFLPEGKKICLTFDEGYENGYTAEILDVLKEKNVKAVFSSPTITAAPSRSLSGE